MRGQKGANSDAARNSRSFDSSASAGSAAKSGTAFHSGRHYKLDDPPIVDKDSSNVHAHARGAISSSNRHDSEGAKSKVAFAQGPSSSNPGKDEAAKVERRSVSERLEILAREAYGGYTPLK